ncbi:hypothetical protein LTR47_003272 [Exophiala xenobiotica]|nr:hypothetical protein LTR92_005829 [Exophiala xenobiotica]KAK5221888.1 hypothetical protein LTR72_006143 [Exophiala xenobiotica]KAK5235797.1 hypothetical protein LTR47_003272 [Exophiala xenobiotica]KAK5243594.1 hypothetical protein LTS06_010685 [Exophiala xenobiotica]KAK5294924.1 hypothetical protein LTR14_004092 [Exophiala xenobiotica]
MAMACSPISSVWRGYCREKTPGFEEHSTSVLDTIPFLAVRIPFLFTQMDPLSNEYTLIPPDPVPGGPSGRSRLKTGERDQILSFHCARKKYSQARQRHQSRDVSFTLGTHSRLEHYPASGSSWDCAWYKYTSLGRPRWPSTRVLSSSLKIQYLATPALTRPGATRSDTSSSIMTVSSVCTTPIDEMRNFGDSWFERQANSTVEYLQRKELNKKSSQSQSASKGYGEAYFENFAEQYEQYLAAKRA